MVMCATNVKASHVAFAFESFSHIKTIFISCEKQRRVLMHGTQFKDWCRALGTSSPSPFFLFYFFPLLSSLDAPKKFLRSSDGNELESTCRDWLNWRVETCLWKVCVNLAQLLMDLQGWHLESKGGFHGPPQEVSELEGAHY